MSNKIKNELKKYIETIILFFILMILLKYTKTTSDFRFVDIRLIYIVVIAAMYGIKQSILSIILSCILYIYEIHASGIDPSYLVYNINSWMPITSYVVVGLCTSYSFDQKRKNILQLKERNNILEQDFKKIKESYKNLILVKDQLQKQIMISKNSFGKVYEITKELDTFNSRLIFYKAVSILEEIMENDSVCIYVVNSDNLNYSRLIANSYNLSDKLKSSLNLNMFPKLKEIIKDKKMFINKDLDNDYPTYAAPIVEGDKVAALVMMYNVDFEKYTLYYQNMFQVVVNLIQDNLIKAFRYNELNTEKMYIKDTNIYNCETFNEEMNILRNAKEDLNLKYIEVKVIENDFKTTDIKEEAEKISKLLRTTDFVGCDEENNIHIIFMQMDISYYDIIEKRFNNAGFNLKMEEK